MRAIKILPSLESNRRLSERWGGTNFKLWRIPDVRVNVKEEVPRDRKNMRPEMHEARYDLYGSSVKKRFEKLNTDKMMETNDESQVEDSCHNLRELQETPEVEESAVGSDPLDFAEGGTYETSKELELEADRLHMRSKYYLRNKAIAQKDARTDVHSLPDVKDHLIIMGSGLNSLYDLIRPLRARYIGQIQHIVIVYPEPIPSHVWKRISAFEGLHVVLGSPLHESDLFRAGILICARVVMLAPDTVAPKGRGMEGLVDANSIFAYQLVRSLRPDVSVVLEVTHPENVQFLDQSPQVSSSIHQHYRFTRTFASGCLFTSNMLDSFTCQQFYHPEVLSVIGKLVSGTDDHNLKSREIDQDPEIKKLLCKIQISNLYQVAMSDHLLGSLRSPSFGSVFDYLLKEGQLALALYRGVNTHAKIGIKVTS